MIFVGDADGDGCGVRNDETVGSTDGTGIETLG